MTWTRIAIRSPLFLSLVFLAVILAGCSSSVNEKQQALSMPKVDAKRPFGIFLGDKVGLIDYSANRVRNQCLAQAGYPQNLEVMNRKPVNQYNYLSVSSSRFGPETVGEARIHGFGADIPAELPRIISQDPNYDKNLERCSEEAWKRLGKDAKKTLSLYKDLGNDLSAEYATKFNEKIKEIKGEFGTQLSQCLAPKGYKPVDVQGFLKQPTFDKFGITFGQHEPPSDWVPTGQTGVVHVSPVVPARRYIPTDEEKGLAAAWTLCTTETGIRQRLLDLAASIQQEIVKKHEATFMELNTQIETISREAAALVGQ